MTTLCILRWNGGAPLYGEVGLVSRWIETWWYVTRNSPLDETCGENPERDLVLEN